MPCRKRRKIIRKKYKWVKVAGLRSKPAAHREKGYAQSVTPRRKFKIRHRKSKYGEIWNLYIKQYPKRRKKRR